MSWNTLQQNRDARLQRARTELGQQLDGKSLPPARIADLLHAVIECGDRVCLDRGAEGGDSAVDMLLVGGERLGHPLPQPVTDIVDVARWTSPLVQLCGQRPGCYSGINLDDLVEQLRQPGPATDAVVNVSQGVVVERRQ